MGEASENNLAGQDLVLFECSVSNDDAFQWVLSIVSNLVRFLEREHCSNWILREELRLYLLRSLPNFYQPPSTIIHSPPRLPLGWRGRSSESKGTFWSCKQAGKCSHDYSKIGRRRAAGLGLQFQILYPNFTCQPRSSRFVKYMDGFQFFTFALTRGDAPSSHLKKRTSKRVEGGSTLHARSRRNPPLYSSILCTCWRLRSPVIVFLSV